MRMFGYYAFHSCLNQIKKLLKSWFIIFILVCGLIGGCIGFAVGMLTSNEDEYDTETEISEEEETYEEPVLAEDYTAFWVDTEGSVHLSLENDPVNVIELAALIIILVLFGYEILSADKNGSKIFLMADVNLLFSAPMKPQSVLLFRLMCQIGAIALLTIYMFLAELPTLIDILSLSPMSVAAICLAWIGALVFGKLLQVFFYSLCSTHERMKRYLPYGVWGIALAIIGFFYYYVVSVDGAGYRTYASAVAFFNTPASRWIPVVGWLKALVVYTMEGKLLPAALALGLLLVTGVLFTFGIWRMKVDFYEDAMAKSEETAAAQEAAKEGKAARRKGKDRADRLKRDGLNHGSGAYMFFEKTMYNRMRFSHFFVFTKTSGVYLLAAAVILFGETRFFDTNALLPVALVISAFCFYRALGDPLGADVQMPLFVMVPESMWAKLFWSLAGGSVVCLLDSLPAMILAVIVTGSSVIEAIGWLLFILTVDLYATTVGTFIGLATPKNAGQLVKQMIMVFFLYFGLLPDAALIFAGIWFDNMTAGIIGAAVVNLLLGTVFLLLSPLLLEPMGGRRLPVKPLAEEMRVKARRMFSGIGFSGVVILGGASVLQVGVLELVELVAPGVLESNIFLWLVTFLPIYLVAMPIGIAILKRWPGAKLPCRWKPSIPELVGMFFVCEFLMLTGNMIGIGVTGLLGLFVPSGADNPLTDYVMSGSVPLMILFMVICAPVMEELIFRKLIIDRMAPYGEKLAVVTSALMFGLFHGNFSQFFYAFLLGLLFGYIYLRTGKLRYTVGLHMTVNFLGSVVASKLAEIVSAEIETLDYGELLAGNVSLGPGMTAYVCYLVFVLIAWIAGLMILCIRSRDITFEGTELELARGQKFRTVWVNAGMIVFFLGSAALFAANLLY